MEPVEQLSNQQNNSKKTHHKLKIILLIVVSMIALACAVLIVCDLLATNWSQVDTTSSLITKQSKLEKSFKISGYTINKPNIILDPYHNSPLSALVIFETSKKVAPKVTIYGKDSSTTYTHTFQAGLKHYLPIYGLYADKNNQVVISYGNVSKTIYIKTAKLPSDFVLPTSVKADKSKLSNQLYFYTPSSKGYTAAYDVNGDVRWYLTNYSLWNISRLQDGHILVSTERLINPPYYMTGLYEIDMLGKVYSEYSLPGGYHHDYFEMPNGDLLVASNQFNNSDGTVEDYVVELSRKTGKIVKSYNLRNILKMEDGKSANWTAYDWYHNNSVWYDQKTNTVILSGRHDDAVIGLDYTSGKLKWIIGDHNNWSKDYQKYFFTPIGDNFEWQWGQHSATVTPESYIFLFDNGNNKSKLAANYVSAANSYSRGVMYKIDTKKMTIQQVWEYGKERGSNFYSPYISNVIYLDAGHYVVHSGGISSKNGQALNVPASLGGADTLRDDTVELLNNQVIFEMVLPTNNYRVRKMSLYGNDQFSLGAATRKGSLGTTTVDEKRLGVLIGAAKVDQNYQNYAIKITKEEDRLVFSGRFKRGTNVNVLLYRNGVSKVYNVKISKKPYTAMCVSVFTSDENKNGIVVDKYINQAGLNGKYSIYIQIDNQIYNTGRYVDF